MNLSRREAIAIGSMGAVACTVEFLPEVTSGAESNRSIISGRVMLGENAIPKGVECYIEDEAGKQVAGEYDDESGEFYFKSLPKRKNLVNVWVQWNGKRSDHPDLSISKPSRLEVRFPDPAVKGTKSDAPSIVRELASIATLAIEIHRNPELRDALLQNKSLPQFTTSLNTISSKISQATENGTIDDIEMPFVKGMHQLTEAIWKRAVG